MNLDSIGSFFYFSLAISAWKKHANQRWAVRVNPSSGNLHPTEAYGLFGALPGIESGLYHYAPDVHGLEHRAPFEKSSAPPWKELFFVGLSSVLWREAWKYGERAFRYCQHDVGHALAALQFSAALHGWHAQICGLSDSEIAALLGLDRAGEWNPNEREFPEVMVEISRRPSRGIKPSPNIHSGATWQGQPNVLSQEHHTWDLVDFMPEVCAVPAPPERDLTAPSPPSPSKESRRAALERPVPGHRIHMRAGQIIRRRRSAVSMDGNSSMAQGDFARLLHRTMPESLGTSILTASDHIDLFFFVHRVQGLLPGTYALVRNPDHLERLKLACHPQLGWNAVPGIFSGLPFFVLSCGDMQATARDLCCGQDIASDGAFSVAMIADFESNLRNRGPATYRTLHWEAGALGQILYLEAEASGLRGTGIGCFFDDALHETLGMSGREFQVLYHFTVGMAVDDLRITTETAYGELPTS